MTAYVPVPAKGDGLRATWGAAVANGINALAAMAPAGMLVREGVGCGCEPLPKNSRDRKTHERIPWSFSCTVSEDADGEETRTGGWSNCILQLGYNKFLVSDDVITQDKRISLCCKSISGTDLTDDGNYVVEVNVKDDTAEIMLKDDIEHVYPVDPSANIVYIDIGTVQNGKQATRIPNHPVVYKYA